MPTSLQGIAKTAKASAHDAEASIPEAHGTRKPHAGICAGGGWVAGIPTAMVVLALGLEAGASGKGRGLSSL